MMQKSFYARFGLAILVGVVFVLPLSMVGSQMALRSNRNDVKEWLPSSFQETADFEWFRRYFFNDTFILSSWDGCTLQDERLQTFSSKLTPPILGMDINVFGGRAKVNKIIEGSASQVAGIKANDIVTKISHQPVHTYNDLASGLRFYKKGSELALTIQHEAEDEREVVLKIDEDIATGPVLFEKVLSGRNVIEQLTNAPLNLPEDVAVARMTGSILGPDKRQRTAAGELANPDEPDVRQTCALVILTKTGKDAPRAAVAAAQDAARASAVPATSLHMGGPPVDNVAIDKEGERMLFKLMVLCGLVGWILTYWCMKNLQLTIMIFNGAVYASSLSLAIVKFSGGVVNSVLLTMPAVVYTSALSCGIHVVNYYRHTRIEQGLTGAAGRGLKIAWLPCLLSAGTTSLGLISLATSDLVPIKFFGIYSAAGVMVTIALLYLYLPSALELRPPKMAKGADGRESDALDPTHRRRMRFLGTLVTARPAYVWIIFFAVLGVCGYGLRFSTTNISLMSLFAKDCEIIKSYAWLEKNLGPLVPMEVVVRMEPNLDQYETDGKLTLFQRLELIGRIQKNIESIPDVGSTMSALTFSPDVVGKTSGTGTSIAARSKRNIINKQLLSHRSDLLKGDYVAEEQESGQELWRISLRVAALNEIDYGAFIQSIKDKVDPVIEAEKKAGHVGVRNVVYTGLTPVVYKAQRALLDGLIESFFWAFVMIAGVMTVVFRDLRAGLYTMLPNVWPVAIVFGVMGWLRIPLDIGTMMTAGVAMGVCVDDTVHFANWFRRATRMGMQRREAVIWAYEQSAGAIYQSTLIVALGLATFSMSSFMPTQRFGLLMGTLLFFGLIADLVLTPAMLSGPIGKFFIRGCEPKKDALANGPTTEMPGAHSGDHKIPAPHRAPSDSPVREDLLGGA